MDNTGLQNNTGLTQSTTPSPQPGDQLVNPPVESSPWQASNTSITPPVTPPWQGQTSVQPEVIPTNTNQQAPTIASPWQSTPVNSMPGNTTPVAPMPAVDSVIPSKKKVSPVVLGGLAVFFIAAVAGGTFLISRGINTNAPVAPNAPASEPKAFDPNEESGAALVPETETTADVEPFDPFGTTDCTDVPDTAQYGNRCVPVVTDAEGNVDWAPGAIEALGQQQ